MKLFSRERNLRIVHIIIFIIGSLGMILAGNWAIHFPSRWKLETSMESLLDPNSDHLTNRPIGFYEPLDPSILTQPAWINVFLTPGAKISTKAPLFPIGTPVPTGTPNNILNSTSFMDSISTLTPSPTNTKVP